MKFFSVYSFSEEEEEEEDDWQLIFNRCIIVAKRYLIYFKYELYWKREKPCFGILKEREREREKSHSVASDNKIRKVKKKSWVELNQNY